MAKAQTPPSPPFPLSPAAAADGGDAQCSACNASPGSSPLAAVTDVGGNATFAAGGISIEIVGVAKADLSDSDFIWA